MRISLNLASHPYADLGPALRRLRIAMALLALFCVLLGFGLRAFHQKAEQARSREHLLDLQIDRINAERAGYQKMMQEPAKAQLLAQSTMLNQLFEEKAFSWTLAMEALETVLPAGVQVSTIEPVRDKDGHIELRLRVSGPRDRADDLVANLERSSRFYQPRIVGENSTAGGGANQRLEPVSATNRFDFDLVAAYNPPTPEERKHMRSAEPASAPSPKPRAARRQQKSSASESRSGLTAIPAALPAAPAQRQNTSAPWQEHAAQPAASRRAIGRTSYSGISRPPARNGMQPNTIPASPVTPGAAK